MSGLVGDEMGLGKTMQTVSLFECIEEIDSRGSGARLETRPYLLVCPLSVMSFWVIEAKKWAPQLRVLQFHGTTAEREHLKDLIGVSANDKQPSSNRKIFAGPRKLIVTTHETYAAERKWLETGFCFRHVVLDESRKIKSDTAQVSLKLPGLAGVERSALTLNSAGLKERQAISPKLKDAKLEERKRTLASPIQIEEKSPPPFANRGLFWGLVRPTSGVKAAHFALNVILADDAHFKRKAGEGMDDEQHKTNKRQRKN